MKDRILKLREEGKTYNEIKRTLGCSKSTIAYHCGENVKGKQFERQNDKRRIVRETLKMYTRRVKTRLGCIDCGNKDWRCLDFDHVRGEKSFDVSRVGVYSLTIVHLKEEMRKCSIRCANCHRIKTYEERLLK